MDNELIKVGDLAKMAGVSPRTVKYYEELGLISHASRSVGGFRYFTNEDLNRIKIIKQLQLLDYPLSQIKEIFSIRHSSETGKEGAPIVYAKLEEHEKEIERKMMQYNMLKEELEKTKQLVKECFGCSQKPNKENCTKCKVLLNINKIPLPFEAIL